MTNLRLILTSMTIGALTCGVFGAVAGIGTSILLPGLGLIVAGPIVAGIIGAVFGSLLGLLAAGVIILARRRTFP